jgi:hypothetical protein
MLHTNRLIVLSMVVLWGATMSSAQNQKVYTPQPEHKLLERFAGAWAFEKLSAPDDGSQPESMGSGTIDAELLGGFFVVCRWSGDLYGGQYKAVQTIGFDVDKSAYTGTWVDSIMSYQWPLTGRYDNDSKEFLLQSSGPGPSGGTMTFRERYQFESSDSITIIAEMQSGEKWTQFMTTKLTRKNDAKPDAGDQ